VDSFTTVLPATIQGIERYLGSGLIKGIGPRTASRIVGHFGVDTLRVIEEAAGRLVEVPGLGPKRTVMIGRPWQEQKAIKEVMVFLEGVGVSTSLAVRIYKKFGDGSISVVRHEPYRLAAEVWGTGSTPPTRSPRRLGSPHDSPQRVQAGIQYTLSEAADHGHCYLPEPNLLTDAAQVLQVATDLIHTCLGDLAAVEGVVRESVPNPSTEGGTIPAVYLVPFHRVETFLAGVLLRLRGTAADRMPAFAAVDWVKALGWLRGRTGVALAAEQEQAVQLALTAKVGVLTGGPGCGKSFRQRSTGTF
jgi:exodeoxyribonuclease V alpha subunit